MLRQIFVGSAAVLLFAIPANAISITVQSYDVFETPVSGLGGWQHVYGGTITSTNVRQLGGYGSVQFANETGGSGTLNDGVIGNTATSSQLFATADDSGPISTSIVLYLGDTFTIDSISIFGGPETSAIPGLLTGVTVAFGGSSQAIATTEFGPGSIWGTPINDLLTLTGTGLDGIMTDSITLSGWVGPLYSDFGQFSITEIRVEGSVAVIPEPTAALLFGTGFGVVGIAARRRRSN